MKLPKNRESGQALIMALILLALGSLLVVPSLNLASTSLKYHQLIESKTLESYSADSGLEYALCELYNYPGGYTETPLQESFTINGRTVSVTADYLGVGMYDITSTATSGSGRSTTIGSSVDLSVGIFAFAVAGRESITLQKTVVNSSPEPGEGHIHSNGDIDLIGGNVHVFGDATAAGTIDGETVHGTPTPDSLPVVFPWDYSGLYKAMAQEGGTYTPPTGTLTLDGGTLYFGPAYIDGNLSVKPNTIVILEGVVYVTGTILVEKGHLEGEQNIVAEGSITIHGGGYGSEVIPVITSRYGDITLEGPLVDAVLYAPEGSVTLSQVHLYGGLGGKTVNVDNSYITYAAQLHGRADIPGGELRNITYGFK